MRQKSNQMIVFAFFLLLPLVCCAKSADNQQLHLSLGADVTQMMVTWVTESRLPSTSLVLFSKVSDRNTGMTHTVSGNWTTFKAGGGRRQFVHRVLLTGLQPNSVYAYSVSSDGGKFFSRSYSFRTNSRSAVQDVAIVGDLGVEHGRRAFKTLSVEAAKGSIDAVFHVGDMAYDLHDDDGRKGDMFLQLMQATAARVPFQVLPGNHEKKKNFTHFNSVFSMTDQGMTANTGDINNFYYSSNVGPMHIVSMTTEFYFYPKFGTEQLQSQYNWLISDLKEANRQRSVRPWIILLSHHPMYCSAHGKSAQADHDVVRKGYQGRFGVEKLLHDYNVDLYISGHTHTYERSLPVYRDRVQRNPWNPLRSGNKRFPVHVVSGSAGPPHLSSLKHKIGQQTAARVSDYSYTRIRANKYM